MYKNLLKFTNSSDSDMSLILWLIHRPHSSPQSSSKSRESDQFGGVSTLTIYFRLEARQLFFTKASIAGSPSVLTQIFFYKITVSTTTNFTHSKFWNHFLFEITPEFQFSVLSKRSSHVRNSPEFVFQFVNIFSVRHANRKVKITIEITFLIERLRRLRISREKRKNTDLAISKISWAVFVSPYGLTPIGRKNLDPEGLIPQTE